MGDRERVARGVVRGRTRRAREPRLARGLPVPVSCRYGVAAALFAVAATAGWGWLHTELRASHPEADGVIESSPAAVTLTYTTAVRLRLSSAAVWRAGGDGAAVAAGKLAHLSDDRPDVLVLPLSERLGTGAYTVTWTTAGPDGHRIHGEFDFHVDLRFAETPVPQGDAGAGSDMQAAGAGSESGFAFGRAFQRFALYVGIMGLLGTVTLRFLVLGRFARTGASRKAVRAAEHRVLLVGGLGSGMLLALLPVRLLRRAAAFFPDDPLGNLFAVVAGTPWAAGWWLQLAGALLATGGLLVAAKGGARPAGWRIAALGALLLPAVPVLSGHGRSDSPRALSAVATYLHVVAAGGWVGGLLCLLCAALPALRGNGGRKAPHPPGPAAMVGAFSRVAQVAVALLLVTGGIKVWIHIGSPSDLWTTEWGRSLLAKDAIVAGVLALGFYNWRFASPALADSARPGRLRGSALIELALGAAAVAATSHLVAQPLS